MIVSLKTALVARGLGDKTIHYTPRYNAFWRSGAGPPNANAFKTDGEGVDVVAYVDAHSEFGGDAIDYVHLMMYDIAATESFADAEEDFFVRAHYDAVIAATLDYVPKAKIIMGFEPGPQAYTGVWGGIDHDKATIAHIRDRAGGCMFWAVNEQKVASNSKTVGENAVALANYAAAAL